MRFTFAATAKQLDLALPAGTYRLQWTDTQRGPLGKAETFQHPGGTRMLDVPAYRADIALAIRAQP